MNSPQEITGRKINGAALVAAGILCSRLAGLAREAIFARCFGNGLAADAFRAAMRIPNILQNLLGEGVLSASFIPVYAGLLGREKPEEAGRVAGAVFSILALITSILVLAGIAATPVLVDLIAPGFEGPQRDLTVTLVRILFPATGTLVLSAWCLGILNSHGRFFLSYCAPVIWNAAMIGAMVLFKQAPEDLAVTLAWAALAGSAAQVFVQLPAVLRLAPHLDFRPRARLEGVRTTLRNAGPAVVSRGVVQISAYIDSILASFLPMGAVAAMGYAQTLSMLPVSLFGMAVSAAELPEMSRDAESQTAEALRARLSAGSRRMAFFVVPSAVAFIALGDQIAAAVYQGGAFTAQDSLYVWSILAGAGLGLVASTRGRLYASAFYALKDTRTPLRCALVRVGLTASLGACAALWAPGALGIDARFGVAGLALSSSFSGWIEYALLSRFLTRRIGPVAHDRRAFLRFCGAALVAAAAAWGVKSLTIEGVPAVLKAGAVLGTFGLIYLPLAGIATLKKALRRG